MPTAATFTFRLRSRTKYASAAALLGLLTFTPTALLAQEPAQTTAPQSNDAAPAQATTSRPAAPQATTPPATAPQPAAPESASPQGSTSENAAPATPSTPATPAVPEATQPTPETTTPPAAQQPASPAAAAEPAATASPAAPEQPAAEAPSTFIEDLLPAGERSDIPHDLSPWGMFMAADWVVKAVMIGLAFASLATWTVWLAKTLELAGARARAGRTLKIIRSSSTLSDAVGEIGTRGGPAALMLRAAADEVRLSEVALDHAANDGVKERVSSSLSRIESFAGRRMSRGTGVLATIGSTAPFVGLFGTVWGIMNSFISISESQTTSLAVVAPGIAEALLATAIGLVAAIPAVVIYNVFARSITGYRHLLADAAAGVERLVSRDLDFRKVPPGSRKASVSLVAGA